MKEAENTDALMKNMVNKFSNIAFWKKLNPELSITPHPLSQQPADLDISSAAAERCVKRVIDEGYFTTEALIPNAEVTAIAEAIERIVSLGLPPVFIYVYDEVWQIFNRLSKVIDPVLDVDYKISIAGMWAWHIGKEGEGFPIHRDMFAYNLLEDGRPKHLTLWIPFTDVTPLHSCMHVLPTHLDPHFPGKLREKIEIKNYSHIRALPVKAGSIVAWNANIAHWGSKASKWTEQPRISIGMDFSRADADMETGNLSYAGGPHVTNEMPYEERLKAIGQAISFYKKRIPQLYPETAEVLFEFSKRYSLTSKSISSFDEATKDAKTKEKNPAKADTSLASTKTETNPPNNQQDHKPDETETPLTAATKCVIRNVDGLGLAVYATQDIAANDIIEECHLVPFYQELIKGCATHYQVESFDYRVSPDQVEQVVVLGFAGSYRHSPAPNTAWKQRKTRKTFQFYAEKDIKTGEEICINFTLGKSTFMELTPPSKLEVKKSPGKGLGVFATQNIAKGEILEDCPVMPLGSELSATDVFTDYRFDYPKGVGSNLRVLTLGLGAIFNHSDNNNAYWINHPGIENVFRFVTTTSIAKGEEVCISYGGSKLQDEQKTTPT